MLMSENDKMELVDELISKLKSSETELRQQAAWDLHNLGEEKVDETKKAIPALKEAMNDKDWAVRKMAIMALGELDVKEEIPKIISFLRNDIEPEVRVGAAEALGDLKAEEGVEALSKALDDSYNMVQQVAMYSLGQIGEKANTAVPKILQFLAKPEDDEIVQISDLAAWALGQIGDKTAIDPLKQALLKAAYTEKKFTIAYSLVLLEGLEGEGYTELMNMKNNYELDEYQIELLEKLH